MQQMTMRTLAATLLCFFVMKLQAQENAMASLQKIYNSYNKGMAIHFTGTMKMYDKKEPDKLIDRLQSSYTLKNKNFSCHIGPVSMLLNDDYYVSVDNSDKLVILGRRKNLPAMAGNPVLNLEQFKKWLDEQKIQAAVAVNGLSAVLQLTDKAAVSGFTTYRIEFNTSTGYMKKVLMETADNNETGKTMVLEISYTEPKIAINASFSEKPFFTFLNNLVQLSETYRNYQLINQL